MQSSDIFIRYDGREITGRLEQFSNHWSFESTDPLVKKLFPYGISSFMLASWLTTEQWHLLDVVVNNIPAV